MAILGAPVTGVYNQMSDEIVSTPAYVANNPQATNINSTSNAGLSIFDNPILNNVTDGITHSGDMGKLTQ
jgi:hypothetical protein